MTVDKTDLMAGLFFLAAGLWFGMQALALDLGTARNMGPGLFPLILSGILMMLGLIITWGSLRRAGESPEALAVRGMLWILPAPIVFGLTVRGLGFVPAVFLTTLIAARASAQMRWTTALLLALGVTVFATLVFSFALGLPFRRFGPWLGQ
jgi:uncharacterized membrane protein